MQDVKHEAKPSEDPKVREALLELSKTLIVEGVHSIIENKPQWYAGEVVPVTKTFYLKEGQQLLWLHHKERYGGTMVGILALTAERVAWAAAHNCDADVRTFVDFVMSTKANAHYYQYGGRR